MKILKFYADWCGPCKQLSKTIDKLKEINPNIEIIPINVEEDEDTAIAYKIASVPVLVKLNDEEVEISRKIGSVSLKELEEFILECKPY